MDPFIRAGSFFQFILSDPAKRESEGSLTTPVAFTGIGGDPSLARFARCAQDEL
jgi:hypothetical protein